MEQRRTGPAARNPRGAVTQGDAGASDALHGQALSAEAPRRSNVAGPPADRAESVPSRVRGGTQPQASKELRARRQLPAEVGRQLSETVHMQVLLANGFAWDSSLADDLDDVRLDSARQLSAIAHRDVMPPESANLVFAKLVKGRALILNSAQDQGGCRSPALAGLLFLGEHHNRWKAHNGMPSHTLPALIYGPGQDSDGFAAAISGSGGFGTSHLHVRGKAVNNASVIAHESVHEAQHNKRLGLFNALMLRAPTTHVDTAAHARAGFLEAARTLPVLPPTDVSAETAKICYVSDPTEAQAYLEEAQLRSLLPSDQGMGAYVPRQDARLHELADLLAEVADALNVAGPQEQAARGILAEFDPARYPEAGEALERILLSAASLHEMAESTAWDAGAADAWKGTLEILRQRCDAIRTEPPLGSGLLGLADALERFLVDTAKQRSAQALALIADTLEVFLERVAQTHGHAVHALKARPVTPEAFDAAKQDPIGVLGQLLERCGFAHAQGLPAAISAARSASGFSSAVADLKTRLGKEEPVAADDLREVVVLLASRLLGLAPSQLPAALVPAVNLYASPVVVLPNVAGLNGVSHQKRKAAFDVATWQLHIPRNVFDAPERLESRLAGLAADVAYAAVSLREDKQFETNHPLFALWYGPLSKRFTNALAAAEVVASSRDFLARHPDSAAAALHAIVQAVRVDDGIEARAWHLGPRAEVKRASHAGTELPDRAWPGEDEARPDAGAARYAYQSRTFERWHVYSVAFRRAIAHL